MNVVSVPASTANLGAGFDVLGMALDLRTSLGDGEPPTADAQPLDEHHPATVAFRRGGGSGTLWLRSSVPIGRGLGFSGVARVGGAALAIVQREGELDGRRDQVMSIAADLERHGDNVAASVYGGIVAWVDGRVIPLRVGRQLGAGRVIAWIPETTTSTDRSRATLTADVARTDVVHNLGRLAAFVAAVEQDAPALLAGATDDRLHQPQRLASMPDARRAIDVATSAGAWCGWLSGSGPTVALWCDPLLVDRILDLLPSSGHAKVLRLDRAGVVSGAGAHAASSTG